MIVDLTLRNFTSLKSQQLFSMYAESDHNKHQNNLYFFNDKLAILRSAGILGANASGKSNLINAFNAIQYLANSSYKLENGDPIPCYEPFLLSQESIQDNIHFDLEFIVNNERYRYEIRFDRFKIYQESLYFYPSSKAAKLFHRRSPDNWKTDKGLSLGSYLKGGKRRFPFFANNSFLSVAGNSPDAPKQIQDVFQYFKHDWQFILPKFLTKITDWQSQQNTVIAMKALMQNIDLGIVDFKFKDKEPNQNILKALSGLPLENKQELINSFNKEITFAHENELGELKYFDLADESIGTRRLADVLPILLHVLQQGAVLFCDEIEESFHTHVVDLIIKIFNDPSVNLNNAQLIFTTHSTATMQSSTMRKDQLWLAEKTKGATTLTSLDDFDSRLRADSPFDKWYADGRLGGIPSMDYYQIAKAIRRVMGPTDNA